LTTVTLSGAQLTLGVSDPASIGFTLSAINVEMDNQTCTIVPGGTLSSFKCNLPTNTLDGSAILRAGQYLPVVEVTGVGFTKTTLTNISTPLVLTSVSPANAAQTGGLLLTITGNGFANSLSENIVVSMCNVTAKLQSVNNVQFGILSVPCVNTSTNITLTYNGMTNTINYTYTSATFQQISSITPISASPVLKGYLNITGNGFGTNISNLQVFLTNATGRIYQLNVLQANDTNI
jgi:hypothetical protein